MFAIPENLLLRVQATVVAPPLQVVLIHQIVLIQQNVLHLAGFGTMADAGVPRSQAEEQVFYRVSGTVYLDYKKAP